MNKENKTETTGPTGAIETHRDQFAAGANGSTGGTVSSSEFTPEEARALIQAIFDYKPETRWERLNNWLARVVIRLKK